MELPRSNLRLQQNTLCVFMVFLSHPRHMASWQSPSIPSPIYCLVLSKRRAYSSSKTAHKPHSASPPNNTEIAEPHDMANCCTFTTLTVSYKLTDFAWKIGPLLQTLQHASTGWSVCMRQLIHGEGRRWSTMKDVALGYEAHLKVSLDTLNASFKLQ
jgi:hypothetical protein